jgi:hypothetical protein
VEAGGLSEAQSTVAAVDPNLNGLEATLGVIAGEVDLGAIAGEVDLGVIAGEIDLDTVAGEAVPVARSKQMLEANGKSNALSACCVLPSLSGALLLLANIPKHQPPKHQPPKHPKHQPPSRIFVMETTADTTFRQRLNQAR